MLERILDYERDAFLLLNGCHNDFWNQFFWLYSGKIVWFPLIVAFIFVLFYKKPIKESLIILLAIVITVTLCDQFASGFCKPFFERFRPTHHPDFKDCVQTVFDYRGGRYGFISSHAANAFGFVTLTSLIFKNKIYSAVMFTWAIAISYSRIYLGVHFISDIIPAIFAGFIFGWSVYKLYCYSLRKIVDNKSNADIVCRYKSKDFYVFYVVMGVILVFMLLYSGMYANELVYGIKIK